MKTLLPTLRQYRDGIDIGQQGSPMVLWSLNLETASLIGRPLKRFVKSLKTKNIQAAIEATCTWYHIYETLDALGVETTLVNMRRTKTTDCTQLFIFTLVKK